MSTACGEPRGQFLFSRASGLTRVGRAAHRSAAMTLLPGMAAAGGVAQLRRPVTPARDGIRRAPGETVGG